MKTDNKDYRKNLLKGYTKMPTYHLFDKELSLSEKGLFSFMLSFPSNWHFSTRLLEKLTGKSRSSISTMLNHLIKCGYISRQKTRTTGQRFSICEYTLYPIPAENVFDKNYKSKKPKMLTIANNKLRNAELSLKKRGLLCLIMALPAKFACSPNTLISLSTDGRNTTINLFKELKESELLNLNKREITNSSESKSTKNANQTQVSKSQISSQVFRPETITTSKPAENNTNVNIEISHIKNCIESVNAMLKETKMQFAKIITAVLQNIGKVQENKQTETLMTSRQGKTVEQIKEQVDYDRICEKYGKPSANEIIAYMSEIYAQDGKIKINGNSMPAEMVHNQYDQLTYNHIDYVLSCVEETSKKHRIYNLKQYMLTALYNSPFTIYSDMQYRKEKKKSKPKESYQATYDIAEYESHSVVDEMDWQEEYEPKESYQATYDIAEFEREKGDEEEW